MFGRGVSGWMEGGRVGWWEGRTVRIPREMVPTNLVMLIGHTILAVFV